MDADRVMFFLSHKGFRPTVGAHGEVRFDYEGGHYHIRVAADDAQYAAIAYPNFWKLRSPEETVRAYRAANVAGHLTKVAKVHVLEQYNDCWAEAELLFERPEEFETLFLRTLRMIQYAVGKFIETMRTSEPLPDSRIALKREEVSRWMHGN